MESTGSYWGPIYNILEGYITIVLANPEGAKTRKGHKTDRKLWVPSPDFIGYSDQQPDYNRFIEHLY
jgi:hypothetical protein